MPLSSKFLSSSLIALLLQSMMVAADSDLESKIDSLVDMIAKMEVRLIQAEKKGILVRLTKLALFKTYQC